MDRKSLRSLKFQLVLIPCLLWWLSGCEPHGRSLPPYESFAGRALTVDGKALTDVVVVLQPISKGYEIEMEVDAEGRFSGEGVPGKYVYYFRPSGRNKKGFPGPIPPEYQEPKIEHLIELGAVDEVVCQLK